MALPLAPSGGPLGALGLGVGPSGRRYGEDELAFAELLVGRAGLALANAQLVDRLTAAQRRLDGILGSLAEAVTVQDRSGEDRLRQPGGGAAARAARRPGRAHRAGRASSPDASTSATRTAARSPPEELPGARVLRGETPEPLLTRSVFLATGELHWFLTKATPLVDETGELLAVNVIEDVTEEQEAALRERFLAEAGERARLLARPTRRRSSASRSSPCRGSPTGARSSCRTSAGGSQQVALAHVRPALVAAGARAARALARRTPTRRPARTR